MSNESDASYMEFPRGMRRNWNNPQGFFSPNIAGVSYLENRDVLDALVSLIPDNGMFVEIGTWTGGTAALVADLRPGALVVTVDNYDRLSGQADHVRWMLAGVNVLSRLNVVNVVADSAQAGLLLRHRVFDVALVDGDHTEHGSYSDMERASIWLKPDGVLLIHDYGDIAAVTRSVDGFCRARGLAVTRIAASLVKIG